MSAVNFPFLETLCYADLLHAGIAVRSVACWDSCDVSLLVLQVFIRELISNGSDSLEKLRYLQMSTSELGSDASQDMPLEIHIAVDEEKKTFTIQVAIRAGSNIKHFNLISYNFL